MQAGRDVSDVSQDPSKQLNWEVEEGQPAVPAGVLW